MFRVEPFEKRDLLWWCTERESLDLSPVYQRRSGVWTAADKAFLIDTILNRFDMPKIYIADFRFGESQLNNKGKLYGIIDGKQRFEAIHDFYDGKIPLSTEFVFFDDPSLKVGGLTYRELKRDYDVIAKRFDKFLPTVMSVVTDDESKIRELFTRLNRGKPLTGAELRNAMLGIMPELFRRLAAHKFFTKKIKFQTNRGQDLNAAAKLLIIEYNEKFVDTKKSELDEFVKLGLPDNNAEALRSNEPTPFDRAASRVEKVLKMMCSTFQDKDPLLAPQAPLPVYYWFVKKYTENHRDSVRGFLEAFEHERRRNKRHVSELQRNPNTRTRIDQELLTYDIATRSPDDRNSMIQRFNILTSRFAQFLGISRNDLTGDNSSQRGKSDNKN